MKKIVVFLVIALSGCVFAQNGWRLIDSTYSGTNICFLNSLTGFSNANGLQKTTDGGYSWTAITIDGFSGKVNEIKFLDATTGFAACDSGAILKTTDAGKTWRCINIGASGNLFSLTFTSDKKIFCALGHTFLLCSSDIGETWKTIQLPEGFSLTDITFGSNQNGRLCSWSGPMLKTTDGGDTWSVDSILVKSVYKTYSFGLSFSYLCFVDSLTGYSLVYRHFSNPMLGDDYESIFRTTDGGISWTDWYANNLGHMLYNLTINNKQNIWYGATLGTIRYSSDTGRTWVNQYYDSKSYLTDLFFLDSLRGWCVSGSKLYKTISGGNLTPPPNSPKLISPENFSSPNNTAAKLVWSKPTNTRAKSYHLQVAKDISFSTIVIEDSTLIDTIYQFTGQKWTRYYWRVSATGEDSTGQYSSAFNFTTQYNSAVAAPETPLLLSPTHNSTTAIVNPLFQWVKTGNAAVDMYRLQLARDANFTSLEHDDAVYKDSLADIYLSAHTQYYWRIAAVNIGGISSFTPPNSFTTVESLTRYTDPSLFQYHIGDTWYYAALDRDYILGTSQNYTLTKKIVDTLLHDRQWKVEVTANRQSGAETTYEYWTYTDGKLTLNGTKGILPIFLNYLKEDSVGASIKWKEGKDSVLGARREMQKALLGRDGDLYNSGWCYKTAKDIGTYYYYVITSNYSSVPYVNKATVCTLTAYYIQQLNAIEQESAIDLSKFDLAQNYPNPFNPTTTIRYALKEAGLVNFKVYDILGREVLSLINEVQTAGQHEVKLSMANFSSGIYIYQLKQGNNIQSKKLILLK